MALLVIIFSIFTFEIGHSRPVESKFCGVVLLTISIPNGSENGKSSSEKLGDIVGTRLKSNALNDGITWLGFDVEKGESGIWFAFLSINLDSVS